MPLEEKRNRKRIYGPVRFPDFATADFSRRFPASSTFHRTHFLKTKYHYAWRAVCFAVQDRNVIRKLPTHSQNTHSATMRQIFRKDFRQCILCAECVILAFPEQCD